MLWSRYLSAAAYLALLSAAAPQSSPQPEGWGDRGDGFYLNPILPADFSDIDAIRVGHDFFLSSSTMQYSPGMVILQSQDLVNWKIIGHVVKDLNTLDPELNWDRMDRAGRGIWAGAIRHQAGKFWAYFGTPDQGLYVSTAMHADGPWSSPHLVLPAPGWDDPCPFWDDDGQGYLVATHFLPEGTPPTTYNIHLMKITADGTALVPGSDHIIHRSRGSEANKLYKVNGLYYHLFSQVTPEGRVVMMERSASLAGPWQSHQLIHVNAAVDKEPNQGGLIELASGKWYFVTHQGFGDWEGRAAALLPVSWIEGWPIIGRPGPDGIGHMLWRAPKPIPGFPRLEIAADDNFASPTLNPAWEWNYQPNPAMWSLSERPGFLRLHAFPPIHPGDFHTVGNVITQRSLRSRHNEFTVQLDLAGMADQQESGLAHFAKTFSTLSIVQQGRSRRLTYNDNGVRTPGPLIAGNVLWLRSAWDFDGVSHFSYSVDGQTFHPAGQPYRLTWGNYRGDRTGIFTSNPSRIGGYLDIDSVSYRTTR